jgi:hypothetical protein
MQMLIGDICCGGYVVQQLGLLRFEKFVGGLWFRTGET